MTNAALHNKAVQQPIILHSFD